MAKRPRDPNQLAKLVVGIAVGEVEDTESGAKRLSPKNAQKSNGGIKGGRARASLLSSDRRSEIARKAARARWGK